MLRVGAVSASRRINQNLGRHRQQRVDKSSKPVNPSASAVCRSRVAAKPCPAPVRRAPRSASTPRCRLVAIAHERLIGFAEHAAPDACRSRARRG